MIGYVTFGTNDLPRAAAFYDALLAELGTKRLMEFPNGIVWGTSMTQPSLGLMKPYDGQAATRGNGTMVALVVGSKADVDRYYALAIELGATDEGKPGQRGDGFYAAYFRDPEGHKLNLFHMG